MEGRHVMIESQDLGRQVHMWTYGWFGAPIVVFPSAAGFAHEWDAQGMIEVLTPLLRAGRIKLYCPESNVAEAWTRKENPPEWRIERHKAYERFVMNTLVPWVRTDCRSPNMPLATAGCSLGASYSANFALKFPETFRYALCMSGRYQMTELTQGWNGPELYLHNPLAYVPNLQGEALERVRQNTSLTLVCGQGAYEEGCIEETIALAEVFQRKGIKHHRDIWGRDVSHNWSWWKRQAIMHLSHRYT
jgi:esterase/lipase superfamily enzyme